MHAIYILIVCYRSMYFIGWHGIIGYYMLPPPSRSAHLWPTMYIVIIRTSLDFTSGNTVCLSPITTLNTTTDTLRWISLGHNYL